MISKILISITFMILIVAINSTATAYEFVKCPGDNKTYPEGTVCEFTDDGLEEDEELEDEQQHQEESDEFDER